MQQIYTQTDEQLEVFTTVFSPQVCRSRTRNVHVQKEVVVVRDPYRSRWPKELDLNQHDLIQVLFREDEEWWFGRSSDGSEGYFPSACVETLQGGNTPSLLRRGSVPVFVQTHAPCGHVSGSRTPKLLRNNSVQRRLERDECPPPKAPDGPATPQRSRSLLQRVISKSRRKSCPQLPHTHISSHNSAFQPD